MQRYELYYDYGNGFGGIREKGDGTYVLAEESQAEIDALHAECDRLTALMEKPKVLEAHEVTEQGFYWHRHKDEEEGKFGHILRVGKEVGQTRVYYGDPDDCGYPLSGEFIGPLKQPEV